MRKKRNYKLVPHNVKADGKVMFHDGTNEVVANQETCEAYGYKYLDGVCYAFKPSQRLIDENNTDTFINNGDNNKSQISRGTLINGSNHESRNAFGCFLSGQNHKIGTLDEPTSDNYINNSSIIGGSYGFITQTGQLVHGGGKGDGSGLAIGLTQTIEYQLFGTSSGNDIDLYIQGDTDRADEITLPKNSICSYDLMITGLVTGGTSGTPGHHTVIHQKGSMVVGNGGAEGTTNTHVNTTPTEITTVGSTGTISIDVSTHQVFKISVAGVSNVTCNWHAVVKFNINQTSRVTF